MKNENVKKINTAEDGRKDSRTQKSSRYDDPQKRVVIMILIRSMSHLLGMRVQM